MRSHVFIPSKGRPETVLPSVLEGYEVIVVVEPQDYDKYPKQLNLLKLPKNNQGICYVRNFIIKEAAKRAMPSFWMMDDDIKDFTKTVERRLKKCPATEVLEPAEECFQREGVAQGALEYRPFGWLERGFVKNSYCDVCVWFDVAQLKGHSYDPEVTLKEDRDITLQLLKAGKTTGRYTNGSFNTPSNSSNKGGLHEVYKSGRELVAVEAMCKKWVGVCKKVTKPNGRTDCAIDWKAAMRSTIQPELC
jgi:hypothetical protein